MLYKWMTSSQLLTPGSRLRIQDHQLRRRAWRGTTCKEVNRSSNITSAIVELIYATVRGARVSKAEGKMINLPDGLKLENGDHPTITGVMHNLHCLVSEQNGN
jgi:hypothetical protein